MLNPMVKKVIRPIITWEPDEPARAELIDTLLDDMFGLDELKTPEEEEALKATREQAKEILTWGEITMDNLVSLLNSFYDGYEACQKRHKLVSSLGWMIKQI